MFDLGWTEMLLIGIVALIVVGPKDLPGLFRSAGQFMGKAKGMAREFTSAMNAAADEAGVSEINKTIKAAANPQKFGVDKIREASQGAMKGGGETAALKSKLSEERLANKEKIDKAMAQVATDRVASEKAAAAAHETAKAAPAKAAPAKAPAKTATKTTAKKAPAQKTAAQKTAKKTPAKKTTPKKTTPKTAAKKTTPKAAAKDAK